MISFKYFSYETEFKVLKTFKFTSERKMMSVLVRRMSDNKLILYTKGADSSVLPRI